ncbi:MAG: 4-hydroxy-tetrahydrodipicolinate synthase [Gemmatimonadota bacterium]
MTRFRGCGTALVTPFQQDGSLDLAALRVLVEWQIQEGINFLVPCGSTGEAQTLSIEERYQVVATVVETAAGRVPVVAGATSNDTARAVAETKGMCGLGVDGILSATPYYNKPTQTGLERHFTAIADASTRPIILYNVPGRTAVNMAAGTVLQLARHPQIAGIKEASGDLVQMMRILDRRPAGFVVLSGDDTFALPLAACGGDGLISVISNEVPRLVSRLVRLCLEGDFAAARPLHYRLLPLIDANFVETNPAPAKCALAMMGLIENVLRLPLVPVSESTRAMLNSALDVVGVTARAA